MRFRRNKSDDTDAGPDPTTAQPYAEAAVPAPDAYPAGQPTADEFDMNTVGIAPEAPTRHKGTAPPVPAQINSVGVAILPGVPLPAWVAPVPAPVAQHPVDPLYQQQAADVPDPAAAATAPPVPVPQASSVPPPVAQDYVAPPPAQEVPMMAAPVPVAAVPVPAAAGAPSGSVPLPPPDPAQWSEHPIGPVVWGPVAPPPVVSPTAATPIALAAPPTGPAVPAPPESAPVQSMPAPTSAPVAAPPPSAPADAGWPVADEGAHAPTPWFQDAPVNGAQTPLPDDSTQYGWLLQPDSGATEAPPPVAPSPQAAPPVVSPAPPAAAVADWPTPAAPEQPAPPTPLPTTDPAPTGAPASAGSALPDAAAAATTATAVGTFLDAPPPAGPPLDFTPPLSAQDEPESAGRSGAMKWILIVGGILVAAALLAFAAFVTPGFLASQPSTTDTAPAVATPATAAGLSKAKKPDAAPTGVFKKMAAVTAATDSSQYATYSNEAVSATVWVAPVFGGSPQSLAQAYAAAGGQPLDAPVTVSPGPRGGQMQCGSAAAKQTVCFWTADGIRGAADITGLSRGGAADLATNLRVALEPQAAQ